MQNLHKCRVKLIYPSPLNKSCWCHGKWDDSVKSLAAPEPVAEVRTDSDVANQQESLDKTTGNTPLKHLYLSFG